MTKTQLFDLNKICIQKEVHIPSILSFPTDETNKIQDEQIAFIKLEIDLKEGNVSYTSEGATVRGGIGNCVMDKIYLNFQDLFQSDVQFIVDGNLRNEYDEWEHLQFDLLENPLN